MPFNPKNQYVNTLTAPITSQWVCLLWVVRQGQGKDRKPGTHAAFGMTGYPSFRSDGGNLDSFLYIFGEWIAWGLLVVASKANLATSIATGHAQESRISAVRVMASRTFHIRPVQYGFIGYGINRIGA